MPLGIHSVLSRRGMLKGLAGGLVTASASNWFDALAADGVRGETKGVKPKRCILLWMDGGPSQSHTFDLKASTKNYENNKGIATAVPGIQISENLPQLAKQMQHLALLRSMATIDADHAPAMALMRSGFRRGTGGISYPHLGSVVSDELGSKEPLLPHFMVIKTSGGGFHGLSAGHLHPCNAPVIVSNIAQGIPNVRPRAGAASLDKRAQMLNELDLLFMQKYQSVAVEAHRVGYKQAVSLMRSAEAAEKPFKLDEEPEGVRKLYGDSKFGKECLLARRLVEAGVLFVEVVLPSFDSHGGGDTRQPQKAQEFDQPFAGLIADLKDRGLLDSTLVIWMGEFGRDVTGNNHHAKAWTTVMAGAGLKVGQVVGRTDQRAMEVEDRPIAVGDFASTVFKALGIPDEEITRSNKYHVNDRPIGMVSKRPGGAAAEPIKELFT